MSTRRHLFFYRGSISRRIQLCNKEMKNASFPFSYSYRRKRFLGILCIYLHSWNLQWTVMNSIFHLRLLFHSRTRLNCVTDKWFLYVIYRLLINYLHTSDGKQIHKNDAGSGVKLKQQIFVYACRRFSFLSFSSTLLIMPGIRRKRIGLQQRRRGCVSYILNTFFIR